MSRQATSHAATTATGAAVHAQPSTPKAARPTTTSVASSSTASTLRRRAAARWAASRRAAASAVAPVPDRFAVTTGDDAAARG